MSRRDWGELYDATCKRVDGIAQHARVTFCGFSACIDVVLPLDRAVAGLRNASHPAAARLADELQRRAAAGIGGEIAVDWAGGPHWVDDHLGGTIQVGGTGAQAAVTLATIGAPALLALHDRSASQLAVLHPDVELATAEGPTPAAQVQGVGRGKPAHYLFEYTAGRQVAGAVPPRSSRVIVHFAEEGLEWDDYFAAASTRLAANAGAAILSGFNSVPKADLPDGLALVAELARHWRSAGLEIVHLELADYPNPDKLAEVLAAFRGVLSSVGMSASELERLRPGREPPGVRAVDVGRSLGAQRVCVHADTWALCASRSGQPESEYEALLLGCLLAASRAAVGRPAPGRWPLPGAELDSPPWPPAMLQEWTITSCAAPYLRSPVATVGLGDTFLAGYLLVLGQA